MSAVALGLPIQLCSILTLLTYGNLLPVLCPSLPPYYWSLMATATDRMASPAKGNEIEQAAGQGEKLK